MLYTGFSKSNNFLLILTVLINESISHAAVDELEWLFSGNET